MRTSSRTFFNKLSSLSVTVGLLAPNRTVYPTLPYPVGTSFSVFVRSSWWSGYNRNVSQVDSPAKVWSGNGDQWHFDGKHPVLKIDNLLASNSPPFAVPRRRLHPQHTQRHDVRGHSHMHGQRHRVLLGS